MKKITLVLLLVAGAAFATIDSVNGTVELFPDSVKLTMVNAGDTAFIWDEDVSVEQFDAQDSAWYPVYSGLGCSCRHKCYQSTIFFPRGKQLVFVWKKNKKKDCSTVPAGRYRFVYRNYHGEQVKTIFESGFGLE